MVIEMKVKDLEDWDGKTKSKSFSKMFLPRKFF